MWKILIKAFLSVGKQLVKTQTKRKLGAYLLKDMIKSTKMNAGLGISKYSRGLKSLNRVLNSNSKINQAFREAANKNPTLKRAIQIYDGQQRKEWENIFREYRKILTDVEQDMIRKFKTNEGYSQMEFQSFRDFYMKQNFQRQKTIQGLMKNQMEIVFNSSWILFGVYIPYGRRQSSGILALQLYNTTSERNPGLYYQWVRVPRWVWDKLNDEATGKQFWDQWYHKNRKNKKYLTIQSIYYNNNKKGK